jgi:hypothetical protein
VVVVFFHPEAYYMPSALIVFVLKNGDILIPSLLSLLAEILPDREPALHYATWHSSYRKGKLNVRFFSCIYQLQTNGLRAGGVAQVIDFMWS